MRQLMMDLLRGIVTALLLGLVSLLIKPIRVWFRELLGYFKIRKESGLRLFLPLDSFTPRRIFEKLIEEGQAGDEVLIVGRTARWLIQGKKEVVLGGIENGLNIKILIMNPEKVKRNVIKYSLLKLNDPRTISNDLAISIPCIIDICDEAKRKNFRGSFEIKVYDFIVINSLISFSQRKRSRRKLIYDFSFTESHADKYQQYYECNLNNNDHFCNKLYGLYKHVYDKSSFYIGYNCKGEAGHEGSVGSTMVIRRGSDFVKSIITKEVATIIQRHSGGEAIRNNDSPSFLSKVPDVFDSIIMGVPPPAPISVQLELTNSCNTTCAHCKRHTWANNGEMSTDMVKQSLAQLANYGVQSITLSGGEPTLRTDFVSILEYAQNQGLKIGVLTNGLAITDSLADAITKCSDWVRISLDASNRETYGRVRGVEDGFERVKDSINNLQKYAANNVDRTCRIGICYSIQRLNIENVPMMIEFAKQIGLTAIEKIIAFKFVHGSDGYLCSTNQLYNFRTKVLPTLINNQNFEHITNVRYLKKFMSCYSADGDIAKGTPMDSFYQINSTRCFTPYLFALIDAFGDVYPCCFLYYDNESDSSFNKDQRKRYRMGSLSTERFDAIWRGGNFARLRRNVETIRVKDIPECKQCTRHYLHNVLLTELFEKYRYYANEIGCGTNVFKQVIEQYQPEVVWL